MDAPAPAQTAVPALIDESVSTLVLAPAPATWQAGVGTKFTSLEGRAATLAGVRAGLLRREKHVLSFAAFQRIGSHATTSGSLLKSLDFRYGGALLGWESDGFSLFQNAAHLLVGVGQAKGKTRRESSRASKPLLILEPEVGLTWKLARSLRGTVGISWRGVWNNTLHGLERNDLDGWCASLGLVIGTYPDPIPAGVERKSGSSSGS